MKKYYCLFIFLAILSIFCFTTCDNLKNGTIILANRSFYDIEYIAVFYLNEGSNDKLNSGIYVKFADINVPKGTGNFEIKDIPEGRYYIRVHLAPFFIGCMTDSPIFELKSRQTAKIYCNGPDQWLMP